MYIGIASNHRQNYFNSRIEEESKKFSKKTLFFNPFSSDIPLTGLPVVWRITGVSYDDSDLKKTDKLNIVNPVKTLLILRDKFKTFETFKEKLPINKAIMLKEYLSLNMTKDDYQVVKTLRGNQGRGVYFTNKKWWEKFLTECILKNDYNYIVGPKLFGKEFRIFLIKGKRPIILQRIGRGKANFHQGGGAKLVETSEFNDLITLIDKSIDYTYLAIDFIITSQDPVIIDINGVPGIEQLEAISKRNIAFELLESIISNNKHLDYR